MENVQMGLTEKLAMIIYVASCDCLLWSIHVGLERPDS